MIARRLSIFVVAAFAASGVACVVASGDGSDPNASTTKEQLEHAAPTGAATAGATAPGDQHATTLEAEHAPVGGATVTPSANNGGAPTTNGIDIGFSTPAHDNDPQADDPTPHPWLPGPGSGNPDNGSTKGDGTKPTK